MYKALDIAKYIIAKCTNDEQLITNLQLQKILYYIQKDYLKNSNVAAFEDEIQAWLYGPVVPNVYYNFCAFGSTPIYIPYENTEEAIKKEDRDRMNTIIDAKRVLPIRDLINDLHRPGGAWSKVYRNGKGKEEVIPTYLIKEEA